VQCRCSARAEQLHASLRSEAYRTTKKKKTGNATDVNFYSVVFREREAEILKKFEEKKLHKW
jgi:hypothetical protein